MVPATITIDLVCPFCWLLERTLARLQAEGALGPIRVRPFELRPETPRGGVPLEAVLGRRADAIFREVRWIGEELGVAPARPDRLPSSRLALEGIEMARAARGDEGALAFARLAFRAYFEEGRDIGDEGVLRALAAEAGVPREAQDRCFLGRAWRGAVDLARREAEDLMIGAVPHLDVGGIGLAGWHPPARVRQAIERARSRRG